MNLFLPTARAMIGLPNQDGKLFSSRIRFNLEKTNLKSSNKAQISLFNLSQDSLGYLDKKGLKIKLFAGYENEPDELIFSGDIAVISSKEEGADFVTEISAGDGETNLNKSIELSVKKGESENTLIKCILNELKIDKGIIEDLPDNKLKRGFSYSGLISNLLDDLTSKNSFEWSIQNEALQIISKKDSSKVEIYDLSVKSGLINDLSTSKSEIKIKTLIIPQIIPGRRIKVTSNKNDGVFKVLKVKHTGDTEGQEWYSFIEGEALK